jgi:hypothetical protein
MEHGGTHDITRTAARYVIVTNAQIETAIANYQTNRDLESLSAVVDLTRNRALALIRLSPHSVVRQRKVDL